MSRNGELPQSQNSYNNGKGDKMNIENSKAQMRKGVLEYCILRVLSGKPLYASDIIAELKDARMIVVEGTLYPLLTRLKNDGLLGYRWEESSQGPPRKYYELTSGGRTFLEELEASWCELVEAVGKIRDHHQAAGEPQTAAPGEAGQPETASAAESSDTSTSQPETTSQSENK